MQKSWEMKIFHELNMTTDYLSSTTKPSKEAYLPALKKAVESMLFFALFFALTKNILLVRLFASQQATRG